MELARGREQDSLSRRLWKGGVALIRLPRCFEGVEDPRTGKAVRHDLLEVLTMALTAAICGAETCVDFADFALDREALFRSFLKLENGLPSHDTFSRLFRLIDPASFSTCFGRFL